MKDHHLKHMDQDVKENSPEPEDVNYQDNPIRKFLTKQSKQTRLIILISAIGLLAFTLIAIVTPFKDTLFNLLYPKPPSQAADPIVNILNPESLKERAQLFSQYDVDGDGFITLQEHIASFLPSSSKNSVFHRGYIIQLKNDPVVTYQKRALQASSSKEYRNNLLSVHQSVKEAIRQKLGRRNVLSAEPGNIKSPDDLLVTREYTNVFNGFALSISSQEADLIKSLPEIKAIYPNLPVKAFLNDSVPLIKATDLWNIRDTEGHTVTGEGITIGIIDTGIDYTHPDLGGCSQTSFLGGQCSKVIGGYNFVDSSNDPMDDHFHGTHVAATAAGNGVLKGVAPDAKLVAYKVLDSYGSGTGDNIISAIDRSADPNQDGDTSDHLNVINLSLGGIGYPDDPLAQAIDRVVDLGVVAVISAGNSGPDAATIGSPGVARKAITVGANDKSSALAYFSSRGPVLYRPGSDWEIIKPDITAPGVSICAAKLSTFTPLTTCIDSAHIPLRGTSMAAPHVAGAAALLTQLYPGWSPQMIKSALMITAVDLGENVFNQGTGMINTLQAAGSGVFVTPSSLGFGFVDKSTSQWRVIKRLTIKNIKSNIAIPSPSPSSTPTTTPSPTASATPTPSPSSTPVSNLSRRVFITSTTYNGDLKTAANNLGIGTTVASGLEGADKICQSRANSAALGGTWKAWLSTATISASSRLDHSRVPYKLLNDLVIANDWIDLTDGTIAFPMNMDEYKTIRSRDSLTWSNTDFDGNVQPSIYAASYGDCSAWTSSNSGSRGYTGEYERTDKGWTTYGAAPCSLNLGRLYCFENMDNISIFSSTASGSAKVLAEATSSAQISAQVKQTVPGTTLTLSQNQFSLATGESKDIDVTLTVDTDSVTEGSYFNEIQINDGSDTYRIPVAFFEKNLQLDIKPQYSKGNIRVSLETPFINLANPPALTLRSPSGQNSSINVNPGETIFGPELSSWYANSTLTEEGSYTLTAGSSEMPGYNVTANLTVDKTLPSISINPSVSSDKNFLNINITPSEQIAASYAAQFLTNASSGNLDWFPAAYADNNNIYIVYFGGGVGIYFIKSNDLGVHWSAPKLLFPANFFEVPPLAITKFNNKLFVTHYLSIVSSSDDGETWSQPQTMVANINDPNNWFTGGEGIYRMNLKVANNKLHFIYVNGQAAQNSGNQSIKYLNSSDGLNWSSPKTLFTTPTGLPITGADLAAQDGRLSIVYTYNDTRTDNPGKVYYLGSSDGVSWTNPKILESGLYADYPSVALSGNNIFVVWSSNRYGYLNFAKSTNGGVSWTTKLNVTDSTTSMDWMPKISIAGNRLAIIWTRGIFGKIQTKVSKDLGETWGENNDLLINGATFNGTLASSEKATHFIWPTGPFGTFSLAYANDVELLTNVTFNGQKQYIDATKSGDSYIAQYPILSEGRYDINVVASDKAGNLNTKAAVFNYYQNYYFGEFLETYNSRRGDANYVEKYDYNNDGRVSILDWSVLVYKFTPQSLQLRTGYSASELLGTYNKSSTDSGFNAKYDVNTDNIVNRPDYVILNTVATPTPTPTPTPAPKAPDLVVNSVRVLGTARVKRKNSINVTIQNKGNLSVRARGVVALKVTQPNNTILGNCSGSFSSPAAGKTTTVQVRNCPAFKTPGSHTITATADSTNTILESNENNNQLSTTINVK